MVGVQATLETNASDWIEGFGVENRNSVSTPAAFSFVSWANGSAAVTS